MYAVIETGGKQYLVREGDTLKVEKLSAEDNVTFPVLAVGEGKDLTVGTGVVESAKVEAEVLAEGRDKKILVYKMKAKKRTRIKQGHRQAYSEVKITKIAA